MEAIKHFSGRASPKTLGFFVAFFQQIKNLKRLDISGFQNFGSCRNVHRLGR